MRTLLLLGIVVTSAFAQSPESISGMIYEEAMRPMGSEFRFATIASLHGNGTYQTVVREHFFWVSTFYDPILRFVDESDAGTFHYLKTGDHTATLTLISTRGNGVAIRNLEFDSTGTGHFLTGPLSGGNFRLSTLAGAPIVNASARGAASASKPLIVGFCVPNPHPRYVLVRAVGPGLAQFNVADAAEDTILEIFGRVVLPPDAEVSPFRNDDWGVDPLHVVGPGATALTSTIGEFIGAFPLAEGSKDSAVALKLSPGAYTVVIRTKSENAAEVLGEVYVVP